MKFELIKVKPLHFLLHGVIVPGMRLTGGRITGSANYQLMPLIKIKRVYDKPLKSDGYRILTDRLWPRGLKKEDALLDEWAKELAPSDRLRNWFDHDPYYWEPFKKKYVIELKQNELVDAFIERHRHRKTITLLYATRYDKLTHAIIIREFLENSYCAI